MYFYKMSNSNILADSCIKKYLKKANDNIEQMKENFANAVFSAMASVLIGIEMWDRLDNFNIILRVLIVLVALLVSYFIITVAVIKLTGVIEWMCRIKGEKKDNETADDIIERFNTEIMTEAVMGISLSQQIINQPQTPYKQNLNQIYIYQCLYYFNRMMEDTQIEMNRCDREFFIKKVGQGRFSSMCEAVLNQLGELKKAVEKQSFNNKTDINKKLDDIITDLESWEDNGSKSK